MESNSETWPDMRLWGHLAAGKNGAHVQEDLLHKQCHSNGLATTDPASNHTHKPIPDELAIEIHLNFIHNKKTINDNFYVCVWGGTVV
jgi:hypothetical protein